MTSQTKTNPYADLPKVVMIDHVEDAGEFGGTNCPHCGAEGRYIYWFTCEDGTQRGAMKGCFGHFPKHQFVQYHERIMDKQKENAKKGWKIASWDAETLDAIEKFVAGQMTEQAAWDVIRQADSNKKAWMKRKGFRR